MATVMQIKFYGYGSSMYPTLKAGDLLDIISSQIVTVGDVVVFPSIESKRYIAHRVVSIGPEGVKTRGDNVKRDDARVLQYSEITGVVISAHRGSRTLKIRGGRLGIVYAGMLWKWNPVYHGLFDIVRITYHWLADSGMFRRLIPFKVNPRVVMFNKPDGLEMQLLLGRRVIGRRIPGNSKWKLRPPFRLFIDESSLPD